MTNQQEKWKIMANAIRFLSIDAIEEANSGHPGMPLGMADVATVLFAKFLKFDPKNPKWPNRDRFILSAGHGSMLLYGLLHLTGNVDVPLSEIKKFRQFGAKTAGHPEFGLIEAVETTTGPLGQGIANAVGMAISQKKLAQKFGKAFDHKIYAMTSDGCLMEGISQEAISLAGHLCLSNLILIFDNNGISIDGPTSLTISENTKLRFESAGWQVLEINGHSFAEIEEAFEKAQFATQPILISCRTIIGFGSPSKSGTEKCHGAPLGADEAKMTKKNLGQEQEKFQISNEAREFWQELESAKANSSKKWYESFSQNAEISRHLKGKFNIGNIFSEFKSQINDQTEEATRLSFGKILEMLMEKNDNIISGSADLSSSNNSKGKFCKMISKSDFSGNYIHYGVREHAMVAIMSGLALHGNFFPCGGSFLVFSDYCRPAIRLAALMKLKTLYIMTHDSIGVGEDGPTHQPIEHLASLRAIPNLNVFRPANPHEAAEALEITLERQQPSLIALTRQKISQSRLKQKDENMTSKGAYVIFETNPNSKSADCAIFATGSEVEIAIEAAEKLQFHQMSIKVISVPCWEIFFEQPESYVNSILNIAPIKCAIEAGISMGWEKFIGNGGIFIGLEDFGASAPSEDLYQHFNITAENTVEKILAKRKANENRN